MTRLALIDYGSGNVRSVRRALEAAATHAGASVDIVLTDKADDVAKADRIVLPGVGHFADCAAGVRRPPGLMEAITDAVIDKGRPFLGVCVGMQLMAEVGREDGDTPGFGWIKGAVEKINPGDPTLTIPHMGWNGVSPPRPHPVLEGLPAGTHVYFTHSYVMRPTNDVDVAAWFDYGGQFAAAVARDNLFGVQFHPEKSQHMGLKMLANFLGWAP